jgi:Colicin V production protein.
LDIAIIVLLILSIAAGVRSGFIKSAVRFVGAILAAIISGFLGGPIASWLFTSFFRESLLMKVTTAVGSGADIITIQQALRSLPDFMVKALENEGITANELAESLSTRQGMAAEMMVDAIAPMFITFIKLFCVIILFMLLMVAVRALANFFESIFRLPMLNVINGLLGAVFGALMALILIWIVFAALGVFIPLFDAETQYNINGFLQNSKLISAMMSFNPLNLMFK